VSTESPLRRMVGGFAVLSAATLLAQVLGFILLAVAARRLGPGPIGSFSFAVSLVGYFAIPANFGVTALAIRDISRDPASVRQVMGEVIVLHAGLVALPYVLVVLAAPLLGADELSSRLIPVVALGFILEAAALAWVLVGRQRFGILAVGRVAGALVNFVLVLLLIEPGAGDTGAFEFAWAGVAGLAVAGVVTLVPVLRREGRPALVLDRRRLAGRFKTGVPLGIAAVMVSIYYSLDSVMLGYLRTTEDVGQYAVAYRLPLALIGFAGLWGSVLFPHASALAARDPEALRGQLGFFTSVAAVVALPIGVGAVLVGSELMPQLFGAEFAPAGTPFVILAWAAAIVVFTISTGFVALALGEERHYLIAVTAGAVGNFLANLVLIPTAGMTGAASATVGAEVIVFALIWRRLHARLGPVPLEWWRILRAAVATFAMVPVLIALDGTLSAAVRVAIGALVFAVAAVALGAVHRGEIRAALRVGGG